MGKSHKNQMIVSAPCDNCPFRKDVPIYLRRDRRVEIAQALIRDQHFPCHKHVDYESMGDDDEVYHGVAPMCAGAAKAVVASGGANQIMRWAERLGDVSEDHGYDRGADVWSLSEWQRVPEGATSETWDPQSDREDEGETCGTVNAGCLAPAGYMGTGGAVVEGVEYADGECVECGDPLCENCADENGMCGMCSDFDDDY